MRFILRNIFVSNLVPYLFACKPRVCSHRFAAVGASVVSMLKLMNSYLSNCVVVPEICSFCSSIPAYLGYLWMCSNIIIN